MLADEALNSKPGEKRRAAIGEIAWRMAQARTSRWMSRKHSHQSFTQFRQAVSAYVENPNYTRNNYYRYSTVREFFKDPEVRRNADVMKDANGRSPF
jgi:hypothetical protein